MQAPHSMHFDKSISNVCPLVKTPIAQTSAHPLQLPPDSQPQPPLLHLPSFQQHFAESNVKAILFKLLIT